MKRNLLKLSHCHGAMVLLLTALILPAAETPPAIQWQASFGGNQGEYCEAVIATSDGGFLLGGSSASGISGNKTTPNYGIVDGTFNSLDGWLIKVDAKGTKLWEKSFGGDSGELIQAMVLTQDGGALLAIISYSDISGNKTSPNYGVEDYWLVRVDANGNKLWDQSYGGSDRDRPAAVLSTADGGFLVAGTSRSDASGNKSSDTHGGNDVWLVKVDANGNKLWDQSYGGSGSDGTDVNVNNFPPNYSLVHSGDGGFLVGAPSLSDISGNKSSPNYGSVDYWLFKLDTDGNMLWDQTYGGDRDDVLSAIAPASDGNFLLAGYSGSGISGNKTAAQGILWLVKVDAAGSKLWDKSYTGTSGVERPRAVPSGDGGFLLGEL